MLRASLGILLSPLLAQPAHAQDASVEGPESLVQGAEPEGIRAGAFEIFPRVAADLRRDNNVYNRPSPEVDDFIFVLRPQVSVRPDLARHELRLNLAVEVRRYFDTPAENSEQFAVGVSGRADLAERTVANGRLQIARRIERRGTAGDQILTDEPISYFEKEAAIGLGRSGGRLELSGEIAAVDSSYDDARLDGIRVDQSFRDARRLKGTIRAGYQIGPAIAAFAHSSVNDINYDEEPNGPRGSSGYSVLTGVQFDLGDLARAEAAVGYLRQSFADPLEESIDGFDFYLSATWIPSPRLQLATEASRSVERSPVPEASALVESTVRVSGRYALGSRILAGLELRYSSEDYSGIERTERRYFAEASLQYQLNSHLAAFAAAAYRNQSGEGEGARSYDGTLYRIGIRWTP